MGSDGAGGADPHPNCIYPLCGCAGRGDCKADPLNTPLPCDVKVGATTFRKGVKLGTLVEAARRWHREAFPDFYTLTDEQKAANLTRLQGAAAPASGGSAVVPAGEEQAAPSQAQSIPATWQHDAGAYAQCHLCLRYTRNPERAIASGVLGTPNDQQGKKHG